MGIRHYIPSLLRRCCFFCLFSWHYNPLWLYFHSPVAGFSLLVVEVSWSHTTTRHSRQDSSGRVISSSQRPLPDNTQHSQQTNIHAPGGIRTHDLSRRAAEDLRLRPRGHWDRHCVGVRAKNWNESYDGVLEVLDRNYISVNEIYWEQMCGR